MHNIGGLFEGLTTKKALDDHKIVSCSLFERRIVDDIIQIKRVNGIPKYIHIDTWLIEYIIHKSRVLTCPGRHLHT